MLKHSILFHSVLLEYSFQIDKVKGRKIVANGSGKQKQAKSIENLASFNWFIYSLLAK